MEPDAPRWRRYLRFWGPDIASDVDDELAFHLELFVAELIAQGHSPAAARAEARRRMGNVQAMKATCREISEERERMMRMREWFGGLWRDVLIGTRQFARTPLLVLVAVITLALGIGANTAVFSIVYTVLLRRLPFADAERITVVMETLQGSATSVGPGQFTEWVSRNRAFESMSARIATGFTLGDGAPERVTAAYVTPSFFRVHHIAPLAGRYFLPEEAEPGRDQVVVLSDALFRRRFLGDQHVIGTSIELSGERHTIVGVAPPEYTMTEGAEQLWVPLALTARHRADFNTHWLRVVGKRKPGVDLIEARQDMERVSRELAALHSAEMRDRSATVADFHTTLVASYDRQLTVLLGAVGFVLLLACLNVASLLLTRVSTRRKEFAIRAALGARRAHIVRQLLAETLVLAVLGGALSLAVAKVVLRVLLNIAPTDIPRLEQAGSGAQLLVTIAIASVFTGALLCLMPVMRGARDLQQTLRQGGKSSSLGSARDPVRSALIIGEIALALVLLTGAGLFVKSARELNHVDLGFDSRNLLTFGISLPVDARYATTEQLVNTYNEMLDRIATVPGVQGSAGTSQLPIAGGTVDVNAQVGGRTYPAGQLPSVHFRMISPGYFDVMRIPLRAGRAIAPADRAGAAPVAVVNATLARMLWPGESPIGKRIACCTDNDRVVYREVIGVTADVRHHLTSEPLPELYLPFAQAPALSWTWTGNSLAFVIRTEGEPAAVIPALRRAIAEVDPQLPRFDVNSLESLLRRVTAANRFSVLLLSSLALLAIILAAGGIYGLLAFVVAQRTNEIGVRVALGATALDVAALVVRQGTILAVAGIAIGLVAALLTTRALGALLYEVKPSDPLTYVVVAFTLGAVALLASYVPARRAAAVDPLTSLKS